MAERDARLVIQFARSPQQGRVKTRMHPALGEEGALYLHSRLVERTALNLLEAESWQLEVWVADDCNHPLFTRLQKQGASIRAQQGADLGERMRHALEHGLSRYQKVVLVGSDCPTLEVAYVRDAFSELEHDGLVFGPATDGGYVLIGVTDAVPDVFAGIEWGSPRVMQQSRDLARAAGICWRELDWRADLDTPEDLDLLASQHPGLYRELLKA